MRVFISLGLFGFCLVSAPAYAAEIETHCDLKAVTVYTDRAMVTCEAKVNVAAGKHIVVFKGLSQKVLTDSLRVDGSGTSSVTLGALSHKIVNEQALVNGKEKELNTQLELLVQQEKKLQAELSVLQTQKQFYEKLLGQAAESARGEISVYEFNTEKWVAAGQTVYGAISEVETSRLSVEQQLKDLNDKRNKILRDLAQVRTGVKSTLEARLPLEAAASGSLMLDLSYQMRGAHWRPVYDARLDTKTGELALVQYGEVTQRTGEDWSDVALTLSTAQPARGARAPDLNPMWVELYGAKARRLRKAAFSASGMMETASPSYMQEEVLNSVSHMPEADRRSEVLPKAAMINTGGFTAEYMIPGPSSVASDGSAAKLYIGEFESEAELKVHIKPQLSSKAYLVAHGTLSGEGTMLPGRVNLFLDNAFIGQTDMGLLKPGQAFDLAFGIDDQIEVERKLLKDEKSEEGTFVSSDVVERRYLTAIQNLRNRPVSMVLDETVPAPKDKKIEVSILPEATSNGYEQDADQVTGLLRWGFVLKPKDNKDVMLGWRVKWPDGKRLHGLP